MDEQEDFLSKIMDAGQPEVSADAHAPETEAETGAAAQANEGSLPDGASAMPSPDVSRETSAPPERDRRRLIRVGYAVAALLAANLLALLAVCLIQHRANQTAMDTVQEALDSLRTVEQMEQEQERLQERIGELEETADNLRDVVMEGWVEREELEMDHSVVIYLWLARDAFEAEQYQLCAAVLRLLFRPETGIGNTFRDWAEFREGVDRMAARLEELGYLKEGDIMIPYESYGSNPTPDLGVSLGTATVEGDG